MDRPEYIWPEEQFREDDIIVFRVRSLSYPHSIAFIKISPNDYTAYNGDYSLKDGEIIATHKLANRLMAHYFPTPHTNHGYDNQEQWLRRRAF